MVIIQKSNLDLHCSQTCLSDHTSRLGRPYCWYPSNSVSHRCTNYSFTKVTNLYIKTTAHNDYLTWKQPLSTGFTLIFRELFNS